MTAPSQLGSRHNCLSFGPARVKGIGDDRDPHFSAPQASSPCKLLLIPKDQVKYYILHQISIDGRPITRILLVNSIASPSLGGVSNSLRYIARALLEIGHEVKVLALQMSPEDPPLTRYEGVEIVRRPYRPSRWPHRRWRAQITIARSEVGALMEEYAPGAIWCRSIPMSLGIARSRFSGPLIPIMPTTARMHTRGAYLNTLGMPLTRSLKLLPLLPLEHYIAVRTEAELLQKVGNIVCFSHNMRRQLKSTYGRVASKIRVIEPGVDGTRFRRSESEEELAELRRRYGIAHADPVVLYVGRLSATKNIPLLIESMTRVSRAAKLCLVGSGPEETRLREFVRRKGIGDRVIFAGQHTELLPAFYSLARVYVLPTLIESFGQTYLEAMACGTPVVGFAGDGRKVLTATTEIIRDGETGVAMQETTALALSAGIERILNLSPEDWQSMSHKAATYVRERFSWRRFVETMIGLTEKVP